MKLFVNKLTKFTKLNNSNFSKLFLRLVRNVKSVSFEFDFHNRIFRKRSLNYRVCLFFFMGGGNFMTLFPYTQYRETYFPTLDIICNKHSIPYLFNNLFIRIVQFFHIWFTFVSFYTYFHTWMYSYI